MLFQMMHVCKKSPGGERNPYQLIDYEGWSTLTIDCITLKNEF